MEIRIFHYKYEQHEGPWLILVNNNTLHQVQKVRILVPVQTQETDSFPFHHKHGTHLPNYHLLCRGKLSLDHATNIATIVDENWG